MTVKAPIKATIRSGVRSTVASKTRSTVTSTARSSADITVRAEERSPLWENRKRECIQDAVIALLSREGVRGVTMQRVAEEVGIAKGTVYLHYKDKQHLLDAAKEAALNPLMDRLKEVVESDLKPVDKLHAFANRYVGYFDERRQFFRVLLYEREVTRVQGSRYRNDRYKSMLGFATTIVTEGIARRDFRKLDATKAAVIFYDSCIAIMHHRLLSEDPAPMESDAKLICTIFLGGIASQKGAK